MHVHMSIWKEGKNTFSGEGYVSIEVDDAVEMAEQTEV